MKIFLLSIFLSLAAVIAQADALESLKVVFETTDCRGATGVASIEVDRIEKIEALDCPPETTAQNIKHVYVRGGAPGGHYTLIYCNPRGSAQDPSADPAVYGVTPKGLGKKYAH